MPTPDRSTDRTTLAQLLETLRLSVHLAFAALLVVALVQFLARGYSPTHQAAVVALTALLAVVYLAGTVWENRFAAGRTTRDLRRLTGPWLSVVLGLWVLLVVLSADAVWLLFPLVFVTLALTGPWTGGLTVAACWAVVAVVPVLTEQRTGVGGIIGSGIGVLFAALTYWTYLRLTREAEHHRQIAEQLRATRDRLLAAENQAGRLAERERFSREIHDRPAPLACRPHRAGPGQGDGRCGPTRGHHHHRPRQPCPDPGPGRRRHPGRIGAAGRRIAPAHPGRRASGPCSGVRRDGGP